MKWNRRNRRNGIDGMESTEWNRRNGIDGTESTVFFYFGIITEIIK